MFFRSLQMYRLPPDWVMTATHLQDALHRGLFVPCPSNEPMSRGWVPPREKNGAIVEAINGQWLIALQEEKRLLANDFVNRTVQERADELEKEQGYKPGRKQLRELKERVTEELLPRAFTRQRRTSAWIDPHAGWLCVDAGSRGQADAVIEQLHLCLDEFSFGLVHTQRSPSSAMADWLAGEGPDGFSIDRDCQFKACSEEKATVTYQRHPLEGMTEIRDQIAKGLLPTKLAMTWNDRISFVLTEKMEIKRLAFLDIVKEEAEKNAEHADEQFDADFALMTGELGRLIPCLMEALGGEVTDQ